MNPLNSFLAWTFTKQAILTPMTPASYSDTASNHVLKEPPAICIKCLISFPKLWANVIEMRHAVAPCAVWSLAINLSRSACFQPKKRWNLPFYRYIWMTSFFVALPRKGKVVRVILKRNKVGGWVTEWVSGGYWYNRHFIRHNRYFLPRSRGSLVTWSLSGP